MSRIIIIIIRWGRIIRRMGKWLLTPIPLCRMCSCRIISLIIRIIVVINSILLMDRMDWMGQFILITRIILIIHNNNNTLTARWWTIRINIINPITIQTISEIRRTPHYINPHIIATTHFRTTSSHNLHITTPPLPNLSSTTSRQSNPATSTNPPPTQDNYTHPNNNSSKTHATPQDNTNNSNYLTRMI